MPIAPGTRLGHYDVVSPLGQGGMGEVYRARDSRLDREVAIKVLPEHFSADPLLRERFDREARAVAALNHPHICTLHDVGHDRGIDFLVMELLQGETLASRLASGPLPLDQALTIGGQVASALDAAHRAGIVHRDLKPANVFLVRRPGGSGPIVAKLLDFGLAKAGGVTAEVAGVSALPTRAADLTAQGTLLGTLQYMAPEQLEGRDADARTDIFALGAVLYEMVTGRKAFQGGSQASLIAAIMSGQPPAMATLAPLSPPALEQVVTTCLAKHPDDRWQAVRDVERQLAWIVKGPSSSAGDSNAATTEEQPVRRTRVPRWRSPAIAGAGLAVGLALAFGSAYLRPAAQVPIERTTIVLPEDIQLNLAGYPGRTIAVSSDGSKVAFVGRKGGIIAGPAASRLFVRSLDRLEPLELPGTEGARQPFFSPDGEWLGFFTSNALKKVRLDGGSPVTIVEKLEGGASSFGTWLESGDIVLGGANQWGLGRVSAAGGAVTPLTDAENAGFFEPVAVGANAVLYTAVGQGDVYRIEAVSLDGGKPRVVLENAASPQYVSSGHLAFRREGQGLIVPFDAAKLVVAGAPVSLRDDVRSDSGDLRSDVVASRADTLVYVPAGGLVQRRELGLVTRAGAFTALPIAPGPHDVPRMSGDGGRIAYRTGVTNREQVNVHDLTRGVSARLVGDELLADPVWRPGSDDVMLRSPFPNSPGLFLWSNGRKLAVPVEVPSNTTYFKGGSWTPDGRRFAYTRQDNTEHEIWLTTLGDKPTSERVTTAPGAYGPRFSPDGRWLAYSASEGGLRSVFVQRFPMGERFVVSTGGGTSPVWSADGRELFYAGPIGGRDTLASVAVSSEGESLRLGTPQGLFALATSSDGGITRTFTAGGNSGAGFDVLPDGRFVMIRTTNVPAREIVVVRNFTEEARRLTAKR